MNQEHIRYSIWRCKSMLKPGIFSVIICLAVLFNSCEKDHFFDFLKSTGKIVTIEREVPENFAEIKLENNIDLVITQGPEYKITLECGENLLPGIDTDIEDSILTLRNNNKFNWVRSYDKRITAYVTLPHLLVLKYEATGTVTNTDTIREDSLFVIAAGGSGYIKLLIDTQSSHLSINNGSADMDISGKSHVNYIYSNGYGPFHCRELETALTFISTNSTNDCYIHVEYFLEYSILNLGNIYYKGEPDIVPRVLTGQGKLMYSE